ncbi:polysaccharide pyruvyl transferase family protein [Novosphingobium sp. FKTRR1]|uniref:polysaccharide pyruvyl transferase family protein n=1 Tax=Novosphingobium sp. FKTRR1 TaxID=2879118 RepID=UPI001CF0085A|nr:polysaccharide pyruvyl transferase family protein [Novosphingobium sp. FKTRR1]
MRIGLLNVKYSPNLGDGLLSECLERELAAALPGALVHSIDLAGRRAYPAIRPSRRGHLISVLEALPGWARQRAARMVLAGLVALRLRRHFRRQLAGCDAVVLGGGNLLTDADLNFPMKIAAALAEARRRKLPLAVHGVGANKGWSRAGRALFSRAIGTARLASVTVRDRQSQLAWSTQLEPAGLPPAELAGDPGLLAARHFRRGAPAYDGPVAGLCVTAPMALRYHATGHADPEGSEQDRATDLWYGQAARALTDAGLRVALFTNGSPEDRDYLAMMGPGWIAQARGPVTITNPFVDPAELVTFISSCDLVVAHRMHACIAAHAFAIPTIGLKWDVKLESFFALAGRDAYIAATDDLPASQLTALARRALDEGVDATALAHLIDRTSRDIGRMARRLAAAAAGVNIGSAPPSQMAAFGTAWQPVSAEPA